MKRNPVVAALLGPVVLLLGVVPTVRAEDKTRQELLKAFEELRNDVQKNLPDLEVRTVVADIPKAKGTARDVSPDEVRAGMAKVHVVKPNVGGDVTPTKNMIKVWAESDSDGKKVALSAYEWKANERFYLVVDTATPVKFALHFKDPKQNDLVQVLPFAENMRSFDAVLPGKPYKLPYLLATEDTDDDEVVVLSVVQIGSPLQPAVDPNKEGRITFKGAKHYTDEMDTLTKELRAKRKELKTVSVEPGAPKSSSNPDDVAIIAVGEDNSGTLEIKLKKGR